MLNTEYATGGWIHGTRPDNTTRIVDWVDDIHHRVHPDRGAHNPFKDVSADA
jgi:hypothetical protein